MRAQRAALGAGSPASTKSGTSQPRCRPCPTTLPVGALARNGPHTARLPDHRSVALSPTWRGGAARGLGPQRRRPEGITPSGPLWSGSVSPRAMPGGRSSPTIRSRSSTVANSIGDLPLAPADVDLHPGVEPVREPVGQVGERRARAAWPALRRRPSWRGAPSASGERDQLLGRPDRQPLGHDPGRQRSCCSALVQARAAPGRGRPRGLRPRPAAAPAPGGSAAGSCWRSAAGCGRSAGPAPRGWRRTPPAAAGRPPPLPAGSGCARWMFSSRASRSIASSRVSRTIAGMTVTAQRLRGPPAPLAHDELVLRRRRARAPRSAGGSRPPGSRSSAPPAPRRRRPGGAASGSGTIASTGISAKRAPGTGASRSGAGAIGQLRRYRGPAGRHATSATAARRAVPRRPAAPGRDQRTEASAQTAPCLAAHHAASYLRAPRSAISSAASK